MDVIELIKAYQLDIMLIISGVCATLTLLAAMTAALSPQRRRILVLIEFSAMILLICDRFAYAYRGDESDLGFWMVRICNFVVFFCSLAVPTGVSLYLGDLFVNEGQMDRVPKRLVACRVLCAIGVALLVISQFTGLYYTFDAQNHYQRAPGSIISYIAPLLIAGFQLSALVQYRRLLSRRMTVALALFLVVPSIASVVQLLTYGISLTNMTMVGMAIYLYICALNELNDSLEQARRSEIEAYKEAQRRGHAQFEQTAEALASAIDAKDEYTRGHSTRVAMYSELIARDAGLSDEECERVYFAALLHDVGKIGIDDAIINKKGRLTDEEYAQIKLHPVFGEQILSNIRESPYLSTGAHYHHERYDGKGYPEGLAGEDIPQIARIIAVADAYDAMTSKRSYRDVRPQHLVREQMVMGMGTQFDSRYARIMLHYVDLDQEYYMHEGLEERDTEFATRLHCDSIYHDCSAGVRIVDKIARIQFVCTVDKGFSVQEALPTLILFDSLDGRAHDDSGWERQDSQYSEYVQIRLDGHVICTEARKAEADLNEWADDPNRRQGPRLYDVEAVRSGDHMQIRIYEDERAMQVTVALPFAGRFSYLAVTGEHCLISDIRIDQDEEPVGPDYIPRIAEPISYIDGFPMSDIPSIQIEDPRAQTTQGIPLEGTVRLTFHAQALPNARLIWHCPAISVFTSADGAVGGDGYKEFILVRLDGEELEDDAFLQGEGFDVHTQDFEGWNAWKEGLKQGIDCEVVIERSNNEVSIVTQNLGIAIHSVTAIPEGVENVFAALTGDQCAIANIRVSRVA